MERVLLNTLILEDDQDHARLLEIALGRLDGYQFKFTFCTNIKDALKQVNQNSYDLIFSDYRLGDETGEDFVNQIRQAGHDAPVICVTAVADHYAAADVTRAGAQRFMLKDDIQTPKLKEMIDQSIKEVARSRRKMAPQNEARKLIARLTPREKEVLELIVEGLLSKQIAVKLGCAEGTIKLHRSRMLDKTGSQTTAELVRIAMLSRGHTSTDG